MSPLPSLTLSSFSSCRSFWTKEYVCSIVVNWFGSYCSRTNFLFVIWGWGSRHTFSLGQWCSSDRTLRGTRTPGFWEKGNVHCASTGPRVRSLRWCRKGWLSVDHWTGPLGKDGGVRRCRLKWPSRSSESSLFVWLYSVFVFFNLVVTLVPGIVIRYQVYDLDLFPLQMILFF